MPRGPSLDPRERRLAIETEDHPIEYLEYEGVIPKGNYGAGPMILWDTGRVRYLERPAEDGLARGKLDFVLSGYKLKGRFALVLSHRQENANNAQRQWLLLKKQDPFASTEPSLADEDTRSVLSGLEAGELEVADSTAEVRIACRKLRSQAAAARGAWNTTHVVRGADQTTPADIEYSLHRQGWLYELKLDGVRVVADKHGAK